MKSTFVYSATALAIAFSLNVHSQSLGDVVKKTMNERYESASHDFRKLHQAQPSNSDICFYSGDNYLYWGELDSAAIMFNQGLAAGASNPLNLIGLGRVVRMQGDVSKCNEYFSKALALITVKGSTVDKSTQGTCYLKMAEVLIGSENKDLPTALGYIEQAIKLNEKNPEAYIQLGDYHLESANMNRADVINNYEKAFEVDPTYTRALLRQGQLWMRVDNKDLAEEWFNKAIAADPTFAPAYREKGELLFKMNKPKKAVEAYREYLTLNDSPTARARYIKFIYLTKEYQTMVDEGVALMQKDSSDIVLFRLMGYGYFEIGEHAKGLSYLTRFFEKAKTNEKIKFLSLDYAYHGKLLSKTGKDSLGLIELNKAMEVDPTNTSLYSDVAGVYVKMKKYPEAISWYEKKLAASEKKEPLDISGLGQVYYRQADATKDSTMKALRAEYFKKADDCFAQITEVYPIFGNQWRGKCNAKLDNQENPAWLAKPYYDLVVVSVGSDPANIEKNKKELKEAYEYMGFYHFKNKNYDCAKAAWIKVQEFDPASEKAKAALADVNVAKASGVCELVPAP